MPYYCHQDSLVDLFDKLSFHANQNGVDRQADKQTEVMTSSLQQKKARGSKSMQAEEQSGRDRQAGRLTEYVYRAACHS